MAKAPSKKKEEEILPDEQDLQKLIAAGRSFVAEPRLAQLRHTMSVLAASPPQSLLLEGGTAQERASAALYWAALLNCPSALADDQVSEDGSPLNESSEDATASEAALGLPGLDVAPAGDFQSVMLPQANGDHTQAPAGPQSGQASPCLSCPSCVQILSRMHRDLFFFDGSAASIKIDEIREMRSQLGEGPREGRMRVVILFEGQSMGEAAANSMLKSLEDPRPGSVFVLTAPQRERLLPTLVSRSWVLTLPWPQSGEFSQLADDELAQVSEWGRALLDFSGSGRGWMERTGRRGSLDARLAMQLVLFCQNALKDALTGAEGLTPLAQAFARLSPQRRAILNEILAECQDSLFYNVNPVLVADWLATRVYFLFAGGRAA